MHSVFGYLLCLAMLTPALSLEVFLGVLNRIPRQHDVLSVFSTLLQILTSVSSPVRVAITLGILLCAGAASRLLLAMKRNNDTWYAAGI